MYLNIKKCQYINFSKRIVPSSTTYGIGGCQVSEKSVVRDLGMLLDSKLTFGDHYDYIVCKANRT